MPGHSLGPLDRLLLSVSCGGAVVFALLLVNENILLKRLVSFRTGAEAVGTITTHNNDVRRRLSQSLVWYDVDDKETIYDRDSVFTGKNSSLTVALLDNESTLELGANSLVVVQKNADSLSLDLQLGSVIARVKKGKSLNLVHQGRATKIISEDKETSVNVTKELDGKLKFSNALSPIKIFVEDKEESIGPNEQLEVDQNFKIEKKVYKVFLAQPDSQQQWIDPEMPQIEFTWKSDFNEEEKLQVFKDSQLKEKLFEKTSLTKKLALSELKTEGTYFWRVQSGNDSSSVVRRLNVSLKQPPTLIFPENKLHLYAEETLAKDEKYLTRFKWSKRPGVKKYRLQISEDSEFIKLTIDKLAVGQIVKRIKLAPGSYFWRVKAEDNSPIDELWSLAGEFKLGPRVESPAKMAEVIYLPNPEPAVVDAVAKPAVVTAKPEPISKLAITDSPVPLPGPKRHYLKFNKQLDPRSPASVKKNLLNAPKLSWQPVEGVKKYDLEISRFESFKRPLRFKSLESTNFSWQGAAPGKYFWRVKNSETDAAKYSPTQKLQVSLGAPRMEKLIKLSQQVKKPDDLTQAFEPVKLTWEELPFAKSYQLTVNGEKQGPVESSSALLDLANSGSYKVGVQALDDKGRAISSVAETNIDFKKSLSLKAPAAKLPANGITMVSFGKDEIDPLLFRWDKVPYAKNYTLQFAKTQDFAQILSEEKVKGINHLLSKKLDTGIIYWRVRANYEDSFSDWSELRHFETQVMGTKN